MRFRNLPVAQLRRLVVVQAQMRAKLHLAHRARKGEIDGRRVHWIAADDDEQIHLAGVHVGDEIADRRELVDRLGFGGLHIDDRAAGVAERAVHRVRERVDRRGLRVAGDHD